LPQDGPVLDLAYLREMFPGDDDTIRQVVESFVEPARGYVAEILAAVEAGDAATVGETAHRMKSAARAIGANPLADLCLALEKAGKSGDWDAINRDAPALRPAYDRTAAEIAEI